MKVHPDYFKNRMISLIDTKDPEKLQDYLNKLSPENTAQEVADLLKQQPYQRLKKISKYESKLVPCPILHYCLGDQIELGESSPIKEILEVFIKHGADEFQTPEQKYYQGSDYSA